jgi:uncharacterized protein YbjT (DUF2867 family)
MSDTTLVFGANGQIGGELVRLLQAAGRPVRAAGRQARGAGQVAVDLATGAGLDAAFDGVQRAFLMAPPGHAQQDRLLKPAIDAAVRAGLGHVVLLSAMGANADDAAPMRQAELHLERSGLSWNVLRPNWFMQNFHTFWLPGIQATGDILLPVGDAKGSFIDTRDIAAVAASLLTRDDLRNQAFDLTGAEALEHHQVARILGQAAGRAIGYRDIPPAAMRDALLGAGLPADYAEFLLLILGFFKAGYSERTTDAVRQITGHVPRTLAQYAADHRAAWQAPRA